MSIILGQRDRTAGWSCIDSLKERMMSSLQSYITRVDRAIDRILSPESYSPFYSPLIDFMRGGKRVRPALLLIVHDALGGKGDPEPAAVAVELIHAGSLIHDDMIDRSDTRRDELSFHVKHGFEMSLLIADYILSLVLQIASSYGSGEVGLILADASKKMAEGEIKEVKILREGKRISLEEYLDIIRDKTAVLFQAASSLGAVLADRSDLKVEMGKYGLYVGMAYQIKDDLLDWGREGELSSLVVGENLKEVLEGLAENLVEEALERLEAVPEGSGRDLLRDIALYSIKREY